MHWNMSNSNYGFEALAHRYRVLRGKPNEIPQKNMLDLATTLELLYGRNYVPHSRLPNLVARNKVLEHPHFLKGEDEAKAFDNKEYVKLHQSTLRKVDVISVIAERAHDGSLITDAKWKDKYGGWGEAIGEWIQQKWWVVIFLFILSVLGNIAGIIGLFM
jgi:hypothetical protein